MIKLPPNDKIRGFNHFDKVSVILDEFSDEKYLFESLKKNN